MMCLLFGEKPHDPIDERVTASQAAISESRAVRQRAAAVAAYRHVDDDRRAREAEKLIEELDK